MYSTGGSSDLGWAAGMGAAPQQVHNLAMKTAWLPQLQGLLLPEKAMLSPAQLHCTGSRLL